MLARALISRRFAAAIATQTASRSFTSRVPEVTRFAAAIVPHARASRSFNQPLQHLRGQFRSFSAGLTVNLESLGDSITTATILKWEKNVGDAVKEDDVIAVVETDKVAMDIRAKHSGVLTQRMAEEGGEVTVGKPLYVIDASAAPQATAASTPAPSKPASSESAPAASQGPPKEVVINVPSMGDSVTQGTISNWMKKENDFVNVDDIVTVIDTDKVSVDIRTPHAGKIVKLFAAEGDEVLVGAPLFTVDANAAAPAGAAASSADKPQAAAAAAAAAAAPVTSSAAPTPAPAKAPKQAAPSPAAAPAASAPAPKGDRTETRVKMTRMRMRIAERLKDAQNTAAMLTTFQECDMSNLINMRKQYKEEFEKSHGVKLGFMSAFVKASTAALQEIPAVNAYIDDATQEIVMRNFCDVSIAVASPNGLVVPVLRNTETMSFADVEKSIAMYSKKAKDNKLALEDMAGGTFTISNGGVFGSLMGTPIINPPQSAILGMHATKMRPVVVDGQVVARPMMYLALTYDHRLIDGREAVTFLKSVAQKIEDPQRLLLDL